MLVLFETPAGYALFKVLDEGKLTEVDDIFKQFESPDKASKFVKLKAFSQFADTLLAATATNVRCLLYWWGRMWVAQCRWVCLSGSASITPITEPQWSRSIFAAGLGFDLEVDAAPPPPSKENHNTFRH